MRNRVDFQAGAFAGIILEKSIRSDEIVIDDLRDPAEKEAYTHENIAAAIKGEITKSIDLNNAPFASWLLARLWYLTHGSIKWGLNIYQENRGCQDGGWYYCTVAIKDSNNSIVALFYIEATTYYEDFSLTDCSESVNPLELIEAIKTMLLKEPNNLAICAIEIENPEEDMKRYPYGWDGNRFLGVIVDY